MAFVVSPREQSKETTTQRVKANTISYLRYKRDMRAVTEFYLDNQSDCEDIIAFSRDMQEIWCIEVKNSKEDFLQDFRNKKKWDYIKKGEYAKLFFNRLFFAVGEHLQEFVVSFIEKKYPQIGVILATNKNRGYANIIKNAKKIQQVQENIEELREKLIDRMSSELAICYNTIERLAEQNQKRGDSDERGFL